MSIPVKKIIDSAGVCYQGKCRRRSFYWAWSLI